jgi:hypothetical protein
MLDERTWQEQLGDPDYRPPNDGASQREPYAFRTPSQLRESKSVEPRDDSQHYTRDVATKFGLLKAEFGTGFLVT